MGTIFILRCILLTAELSAALTGFLHWNKLKKTYWKWFPFYLLFIVLSEGIGFILSTLKMKHANLTYFNYFVIPVEFLFFFWLFQQAFKNLRITRIAFMCILIYICSVVIDYLFLHNSDAMFLASSYTIGNLLLLVLVFDFFYQLVTTDAILHFKENMLFWVSTGLLLFYLGSFPFYGLRNILGVNYKELYRNYGYIVYVLNILMYLMFTFSFIWGKPNTKYSLS